MGEEEGMGEEEEGREEGRGERRREERRGKRKRGNEAKALVRLVVNSYALPSNQLLSTKSKIYCSHVTMQPLSTKQFELTQVTNRLRAKLPLPAPLSPLTFMFCFSPRYLQWINSVSLLQFLLVGARFGCRVGGEGFFATWTGCFLASCSF